ncbi:MAG: hypothetical protein CVU60_08700 [Deltaproteobacteria bacterium HGW-Deltaproteobacteria-18]|nr:MAG: hypothetical protein CVU60_08700 [Deltaproteobacteria bacterium HGW-Deltaproteobacteria-18]
MNLQRQHRETLLILGYMYLRMGELERAGRLFAALIAVSGERTGSSGTPALDFLDRLAHASMAMVDLERDDPGAALDNLHKAMDGRVLSSREAALHLLRARALWRQDRREEARQAVDAFIGLGGRLDGGQSDGDAKSARSDKSGTRA